DTNIQLLTNAINTALGAYGAIIDLDNFSKQYQGSDGAFQQFLTAAKAGQVGVAFFLNSNPAYDYFNAEDVKAAIEKVDYTLSFADRADETASELNAIAPNCTFLESWGDASVTEGLFTVVQPTINPVFNTRQVEESLLVWAGVRKSASDFVKEYWEANILPGTGKAWKDVLQEGFIYKGTATGSSYSANVDVSSVVTAINNDSKRIAGDVELRLYESPNIRDGRWANNAYLQELPDPVFKVTWDNYAAVNPADAEELCSKETGKVAVEANGYKVDLPVLLQPGQARGTVSVAIGYGRTKVGKAGDNVGVNAYPFASLVNG